MSERQFIRGHKTLADGSRVALTADEAEALWQACEDDDQRRREAMPDSMAAIRALHDARTRLKDEGWREGIYCPKDGTEFAVIEYGSTGIFSGFYSGTWPDGYVMVCDGLSRPQGIMWKALDKLSEDERAKLETCMASEREAFVAMMDRYSTQ